jgi:structural maintenance of chromosome 2
VTKKKALAKRTTELKTRQKESQTAELELGMCCLVWPLYGEADVMAEQMEVDCQAAADEIKEIEAAVAKAQKEQATLEQSLANQKVSSFDRHPLQH